MGHSDDRGAADRDAAGAHEVVVISAWSETGGGPGLRIRLSRNVDDDLAARHTKVVSSVDEACVVVGEWLEAFRARTGGLGRSAP